jgi:hypothetical protein
MIIEIHDEGGIRWARGETMEECVKQLLTCCVRQEKNITDLVNRNVALQNELKQK